MADGSGAQQGVQGLLTGTVVSRTDRTGQWRVQVNVPALGAAGQGLWARLSNVYASEGAGMLFMPEIGDEVVLGLLDGDASSPVILGSLYSAKRPPPIDVDAYNNNTKGIVSRTGMTLFIDEASPSITIRTPGMVVILDEAAQRLSLTDRDSEVTLSPDGITLRTFRNVTINAAGTFALNADHGVSIRSVGGDVSVDGQSVTAHAQTALKATGSAVAELSSSGQTTVRGALVKIN